jgi:hypothetical protein
MSVPADKLRLYERLVAAAGIDPKENFGASYTAVNGNMFSMISKHGIVGIRLPDGERDAFLENTKALTPYLRRSFEYASSLRPKATKKKKQS